MACEIEWMRGASDAWARAFGSARRSTLLQHLPYAFAMRDLEQRGARQGLIHVNGRPAGVVLIGEVGILGNAVHAVTLDRGPILFEPSPTRELVASFFSEFRKQFPRRFGRKLRVIPEIEGESAGEVMAACGFCANRRITPYVTAWLDLNPSLDALRASLKGKWRNALSRAERSQVKAVVDQDLSTFPAFLMAYECDKADKAYDGPSTALIGTLVRHMLPRGEVLLINAMEGDTAVASILILQHGLAATYQCGWTTTQGRNCNAHHLLLWHAVQLLKKRGVVDLDLGGLLADQRQEGLRRFKLGIGARETSLAGGFN